MFTFAAELKRGMCLSIEGCPYVVIDSSHVKYGKGAPFVKAVLLDVLSNTTRQIQLNPMKRLEIHELVTSQMQYLYSNGNDRVFIDMTASEEISVPSVFFGDDAQRLKEGDSWNFIYLDGKLFAATPWWVTVPGAMTR